MEVMMILGAYSFGLNTAAFQELNRNTEWRWQAQDVFGAIPVLQYTGQGRETIVLPGVIHPEYWGGSDQVNQLRALADAAAPQTLIDGGGNIIGDFVVTAVMERQSIFGLGGGAKRQEFAITLERYGNQALATIGTVPVLQVSVSSQTAAITNLVDTAGAQAAKEVSSMQAAVASIQNIVTSTVGPVYDALNAAGQGLGAARDIQRATRDARAAVSALGEISSFTEAQSALGGLMRSTSDAAQVSVSASSDITRAMGELVAAGESSGALGVLRAARDATNRVVVTATTIRGGAQESVRGFE